MIKECVIGPASPDSSDDRLSLSFAESQPATDQDGVQTADGQSYH